MKQKIMNLIAATAFLLLAFVLFVHCTYLFRNTDRAARQNILGLYCEEDDSLDVVFVGPSSVFCYWSPMKAWDLYGFTSYDFSVSAMSRATVLTAIKDLRRTQSEAVIVVDVRPFFNVEKVSALEYPERNLLDSLDQSLVRLQGIQYLADNSKISEREIGSEYMELAQYHNNKMALAEKLNWQLADNRLNGSPDGENFFKGFSIAARHMYQSADGIQLSDETAEEISEYYMDLLEYGSKNNLKLFFVASPLIISEQQSENLNKMQEAAKEYGYGFIDGNRFCNEMNLDYRTDFFNGGHVNILGAEKWTEFVGDYLVRYFNLHDHRKDPAYHDWNVLYEQYRAEAETAADETKKLIQDHDASLKSEKMMRETENFPSWFRLANDDNISILVSVDTCSDNEILSSCSELLRWFGIDEAHMGTDKQYYALYCNQTVHAHTSELCLEGTIGGAEIPFIIQKKNETKLIFDEKEWQIPLGKISFFAVDNNLNQAVDFVELQIGNTGDIRLEHLTYE